MVDGEGRPKHGHYVFCGLERARSSFVAGPQRVFSGRLVSIHPPSRGVRVGRSERTSVREEVPREAGDGLGGTRDVRIGVEGSEQE